MAGLQAYILVIGVRFLGDLPRVRNIAVCVPARHAGSGGSTPPAPTTGPFVYWLGSWAFTPKKRVQSPQGPPSLFTLAGYPAISCLARGVELGYFASESSMGFGPVTRLACSRALVLVSGVEHGYFVGSIPTFPFRENSQVVRRQMHNLEKPFSLVP